MKGRILELNQSKKFAGRTYVKWVVLEIHNDPTKYNKNGISWKEEYIEKNLESAFSMPLAVEFLDYYKKDEPFGHGMSEIKDGTPLFEDSVAVGTTTNAYIDTVEINAEQKRVMVAEGYLYDQRYPKFVQWLKSKMFDGEMPETSVEICKKEENENIIYESGWKEEGRIPMDFDFSGVAILGIEPSDDTAILLELNNKINKEDIKNMPENQNTQLVSELNEKLETKVNEISELKSQLKDLTSSKDSEINEINQKLEKATSEFNEKIQEKTTELNSTIEELKEVNSKLEEKEKTIEVMEKEVSELRSFKEESTKKELQSELNSKLSTYTDSEKEIAKELIDKCEKEPTNELITQIVNEINSNIAKKIIEQRSKSTTHETNSVDDIYSDVIEVNNNETPDIEDLY
ncbi:hypothetical protein [Halalkalibacter oceani]|uniref:hypothetical protein n=1 Tax=Halalkalibacter oceani TaxID=1653776 RepID=UPI00339937A0